jgi:capsular polysaccharide biosynthesis protein
MWRRAKVVVAPHGAGLSNAMFCREGAVVVEIGSKGSLGPLIFQQISVMAGVQHYYYLRPNHKDPIPEQLVEETQRIVRYTMDPTGMTEDEKTL